MLKNVLEELRRNSDSEKSAVNAVCQVIFIWSTLPIPQNENDPPSRDAPKIVFVEPCPLEHSENFSGAQKCRSLIVDLTFL